MSKFYLHHVFDCPWETTTQAFWNKYPNPQLPHLKDALVVSRFVDDSGHLRSTRIMCVEQNVPLALRAITPGLNKYYAVEETVIDPVSRRLSLRTQNISFSKILSAVERSEYVPDPAEPAQRTSYSMELTCTASVPTAFVRRRAEHALGERAIHNASGGLEVMEHLSRNLSTSSPRLNNSYNGNGNSNSIGNGTGNVNDNHSGNVDIDVDIHGPSNAATNMPMVREEGVAHDGNNNSKWPAWRSEKALPVDVPGFCDASREGNRTYAMIKSDSDADANPQNFQPCIPVAHLSFPSETPLMAGLSEFIPPPVSKRKMAMQAAENVWRTTTIPSKCDSSPHPHYGIDQPTENHHQHHHPHHHSPGDEQ